MTVVVVFLDFLVVDRTWNFSEFDLDAPIEGN